MRKREGEWLRRRRRRCAGGKGREEGRNVGCAAEEGEVDVGLGCEEGEEVKRGEEAGEG